MFDLRIASHFWELLGVLIDRDWDASSSIDIVTVGSFFFCLLLFFFNFFFPFLR